MLVCRWRDHTSDWWVRASTFTCSATAESPATGRWCARSTPDDLGQRVRIPAVALRPRHPVPFPVPGHLQRVDRIHRVPGGDQRGHPRATVSLDPHQHRRRLGVGGQMISHQPMERLDPGHPLRQPPVDQPPSSLVADLDIVVILSPVIADEQHPWFLLPLGTTAQSLREETGST
jgi:hypothetical protein